MIELTQVHKSFGPKQVLAGADLSIEEGKTHVILGRSGEGKSVLLKHICALLAPDAGEVHIGDLKVDCKRRKSVREVRRQVQMLFQSGALFDSMSVAQNVAFHAIEHGKARSSKAEEVARPYLEMVDMADAGPLRPSELSGGMRKRVGLARALAVEPRIMLYDEPTTGLDPLTSQVINELIRATQERLGVTSVVVTHDMQSARYVSDRCSFLSEGQFVAHGTFDELASCDHPTVRRFFEVSRGVPRKA